MEGRSKRMTSHPFQRCWTANICISINIVNHDEMYRL